MSDGSGKEPLSARNIPQKVVFMDGVSEEGMPHPDQRERTAMAHPYILPSPAKALAEHLKVVSPPPIPT